MEIRPGGYSSLAKDLQSTAQLMEQYRGQTRWGDSLGSSALNSACNDFSSNWSAQVSISQFRLEDFASVCTEAANVINSDDTQVASQLSF